MTITAIVLGSLFLWGLLGFFTARTAARVEAINCAGEFIIFAIGWPLVVLYSSVAWFATSVKSPLSKLDKYVKKQNGIKQNKKTIEA